MIRKEEVTCLIPARYDSSRLPGKLLSSLGTKTVLENVYWAAVNSGLFSSVIIASGDKRISDYCKSQELNYLECFGNFESGSERIIWAAKKLKLHGWIVNLQGDQPFITNENLNSLLSKHDLQSVTTLIVPTPKGIDDGAVRATVNSNGEIVTFSRASIPSGHSSFAVNIHVGIYLYPQPIWQQKNLFHDCPWSIQESLEQLNLICKGVKFLAAISNSQNIEINTHADLEQARLLLAGG